MLRLLSFPNVLLRLTFYFTVCLLFLGAGQDRSGSQPLLVGAAKRDISPTRATVPPDGSVYLGGYHRGRRASGVLAPIFVRAFVVSNGQQTIAFATSETQGVFAAYKSGPFGIVDVAAQVEAVTGGRIPRAHVIVSSVHSHSGPDTTGLWGGVPDAYLAFLRDQTVGAIVDAFSAMQPARLELGTANATGLMRSQFGVPPNLRIDGELRVLVASDPANPGRRRTALVNFAAHADVLNASNTLLAADWPGVVAGRLEEALGVDTTVVMVGANGRTQPKVSDVNRTPRDRLAIYSQAVVDQVLSAATRLTPHQGSEIAATQLFLRELYVNPLASFAETTGGSARSTAPPWVDGYHVGTLVSAARIGNLFFAGVPGEGYPGIQYGMRDSVAAGGHFIFGLANDQLGYLISPLEGYPQIAAAARTNDNARYSVSPSMGDHVLCTLLKAARQIGFAASAGPAGCLQYAEEDNSLPF